MLYNRAVRRILSILLTIVFGLPMVSPLFALQGSPASNLPACCRRDGKHHCMLAMDGAAPASAAQPDSISARRFGAPMLSERCPFGSKAMPGNVHPDWTPDTTDAVFAGLISHPSQVAQTESRYRISADRSRQKRGPPAEVPA
jgi:hypothetical protein